MPSTSILLGRFGRFSCAKEAPSSIQARGPKDFFRWFLFWRAFGGCPHEERKEFLLFLSYKRWRPSWLLHRPWRLVDRLFRLESWCVGGRLWGLLACGFGQCVFWLQFVYVRRCSIAHSGPWVNTTLWMRLYTNLVGCKRHSCWG